MKKSSICTCAILYFILKVCCGQQRTCKLSLATVELVEHCPKTEQEYDIAAKAKNCAKFSKEQTCSQPDYFRYHCLVNEFNEKVEVCAPILIAVGGICIEFEVKSASLKKTHVCPDCPFAYNSSNIYRFPSCYRISAKGIKVIAGKTKPNTVVQNKKQNAVVSQQTNEGLSPWSISGIIITSFGISCCLTSFIIDIFKRVRKTIRRRRNRMTDDEEEDKQESSESEEDHTEEEVEGLLSTSSGAQTAVIEYQGYDHAGSKKISKDSTSQKYLLDFFKRNESLPSRNLEKTDEFLRYFRKFDDFFVESEMYKAAQEKLNEKGLVIIIGPPGCGKTVTSVHLLLQTFYGDWDKRKISSLNEFSFIQIGKPTILFIDNIFSSSSCVGHLDDLWEEFTKRYDYIENLYSNNPKDFHVLINGREHVFNSSLTKIKRERPYFYTDCVIDTQRYGLTDGEKSAILKKNLMFSMSDLDKHEDIDESICTEIMKTCSSLDFPLRALIYASCKRSKPRNVIKKMNFGIVEYLKTEMKEELSEDKCQKVKTLFFILFFSDWYSREDNHKHKLNIASELQCRKLLRNISDNLVSRFEPFDFRNLLRVAKMFTGVFVTEIEENVFKVIDDGVFCALGSTLCDLYFEKTARYFPLNILVIQDYKSFVNKPNKVLATRLIYEVLNQNANCVFTCLAFKLPSFVHCFVDELEHSDKNAVECFFTVRDKGSKIELPPTFWVTYNKRHYLAENLQKLVDKCCIDSEFHFYVSLFGHICAEDRILLNSIQENCRSTLKEIKKRVLNYKDKKGNSIIHILTKSKWNDDQIWEIINRLKENKDLSLNLRNEEKMTSLMLAVQCSKPREKVISGLISLGAKLKYLNSNGLNAFHLCVLSEKGDIDCAKTLTLLLQSKACKELYMETKKGETVLMTALQQIHQSRILSILTLLSCEGIDKGILNFDYISFACRPFLEFEFLSQIVELEICVRLTILIIYGIHFGNGPNLENETEIIVMCERKKWHCIASILKNSDDEIVMVKTIQNLMKTLPEKPNICETRIPDPWKSMSNLMRSTLENAMKYLSRYICDYKP